MRVVGDAVGMFTSHETTHLVQKSESLDGSVGEGKGPWTQQPARNEGFPSDPEDRLAFSFSLKMALPRRSRVIMPSIAVDEAWMGLIWSI